MTSTPPTPPPALVRSRTTVYADFTCASCYLASIRADRLIERGHPAPDWRAVEHRPRLPLAGIRLHGSAQAIRGRELAATRLFLQPGERFEARNPRFLPNTRAAIAAYAEAYEVGIAKQARRLLFNAYWVQGADIGDPEVLRKLLAAEIVSTAAHLRVRDWEQGWLALGPPVDLMVVNRYATECGPSALHALTEAGVQLHDHRCPPPSQGPGRRRVLETVPLG